MKTVVFFHDMVGEGPVWRNGFAPLIDVLDKLGDMTLLHAPWSKKIRQSSFLGKVNGVLGRSPLAVQLADTANRQQKAPDLLFAIALNARMVRLAAETFDRVATSSAPRVLYLAENVETDAVLLQFWKSFDHIVCFCPQLSRLIEDATDVPTSYWPPHLDLLNFHSSRRYRPIDLLCFGRSRPDLLFELQERFSNPERARLCIDFVTRTQPDRRQSAATEFSLLFDTLSKSRSTFCFAPHDVDRFRGRSPLLARWVYAWAAGCVVFGTRPRASEAQAFMNWERSTIELPDDVDEASAIIESELEDDEAIHRQGLMNLSQAMARHDTRYRLDSLFSTLGLGVPPILVRDMQRIAELSVSLKETLHRG